MNVGDRVRVIFPGRRYTTYSKFFKLYCPEYLDQYNIDRVENGWYLQEGDEGDILFLGKHHRNNRTLAVILTDKCRIYLVDVDGLERIGPSWNPVIERDAYEAVIFG